MNELNEIDDNINELIMSKSFDRLTEAEKLRALAHTGSEEEYNSLRQTLLAITTSFSDETEEDFAGAEMKNDLMARFEQKYGTAGNRTKVLPLYRKPYFQLAIAASLALMIFLAIPVFKNNKTGNDQLALNNKTPHTETAVTGNTAPEREQDLAPAAGSPAIIPGTTPLNNQDRQENTLPVPTDETSKTLNKEVPAEEEKAELKPGKIDDALSKKNMETELAEQSNHSNLSQNNYAAAPPPATDKDLAEAQNTTRKSDAKASRKLKEKQEREMTTYRSNAGDYVHDNMNHLDDVAAGAATHSPAKYMNTATFVEQNKTEMIEMLFTVY